MQLGFYFVLAAQRPFASPVIRLPTRLPLVIEKVHRAHAVETFAINSDPGLTFLIVRVSIPGSPDFNPTVQGIGKLPFYGLL